jgi:hypothetical protein
LQGSAQFRLKNDYQGAMLGGIGGQLMEDHLHRVLQEKEVVFEMAHRRHDGSTS